MENNFFGAPVAPAAPGMPFAAPVAAPVQAPVNEAPVQAAPAVTYTKANLPLVYVNTANNQLCASGSATDGIALYLNATIEELTANPNWRASLLLKSGQYGPYLSYSSSVRQLSL
jgi:hypothetical protein